MSDPDSEEGEVDSQCSGELNKMDTVKGSANNNARTEAGAIANNNARPGLFHHSNRTLREKI